MTVEITRSTVSRSVSSDELSHRALFDGARLVEQIRQSMRRLRSDRIDICLIHAPSLAEVKRGAALEVLRALQELGMVRAIGYSFENEATPRVGSAEATRRRDELQYNLIDVECAATLRQADEQGVGGPVGGPYKRGYLTGRFSSPPICRHRTTTGCGNVSKNPGKVAHTLGRVRELLARYATPAELRRAALQFVLNAPAVGAAVVGHRSLEEVSENLSHAAAT